jgi:hypothetical protein
VGVDQVLIPVQRAQDVEYRANFPAFELTQIGTDVTSRGLMRYHSSAAPVAENGYHGRGNEARYRNPELDALIERYVTTVPRAERSRILGDIVHHQTDQVTILGLAFALMPTMVGARLHQVTTGYWGGAVRSSEAWNAQEWVLRGP